MRLGKEQAAGYVADVETDEIAEPLTAPAAAPAPAQREPETVPTTG
ncbi:MAG TPA: hypothetical protein VG164_05575 [Trebonia sp.]|jgi:hypothetical protein|nr:hypothetical protein [Trebonia sp.]